MKHYTGFLRMIPALPLICHQLVIHRHAWKPTILYRVVYRKYKEIQWVPLLLKDRSSMGRWWVHIRQDSPWVMVPQEVIPDESHKR